MKYLKPILLILLSIFTIVIVVIAVINMQHRRCEKIDIIIHHEGNAPSVTPEELILTLKEEKIKIVGQERKEINEDAILTSLSAHPYIKQISSIRFFGKTLLIDIVLRELLLHVYPIVGEQYFIDNEGFLLPYNPNVQERLLVANGYIQDVYRKGLNVKNIKSPLWSIFETATLIYQNDFYKAQFKQLYLNQYQEIEMIPTLGKHVILLGKGENLEEKLFNMEQTYKQALVYLNSEQYIQFDVRFKNRVVAKKKNN